MSKGIQCGCLFQWGKIMPKLILRCNYLKNAPAAHLSNFINYIATRKGVEKVSNTTASLPATVRQKELIKDILNKIEDADKMHEYYDYLQKPTRENASEFITQALEYNLDIIGKKRNYTDYLANRPGVERIGSHGLFSTEGESIALAKVQEEVANHPGVIWTNVVSLRREDAERLGYDSATQWQDLIRSRVQLFAENYKIDGTNLKWYAAFHNESHHPHIHLVVYSTNPSEGFLTKTGIENMRSTLAHDIFRQDFMSIYQRKTEQRDLLKEQAETSLLFLMEQMRDGVCHNEKIAERLQNTSGKKVYGYLKADVKAIVDELAKESLVAECYQKWQDCQNGVLKAYKDTMPEPIPLSQQKDLKSIKNMIIRHAVNLGEGVLYADDEAQEEADQQNETGKKHSKEQPYTMLFDKNIASAIHYLDKAAVAGNPFAQYALGKIYLIGKDVEQDKERAWDYFTRSAEQGNLYAQYFLEHWNEMYHPDLCLMATRLMHHLEQTFADQMADKKGGSGITESKLRRKIREKKIAQGHAGDDHESMQNIHVLSAAP